MAYVIYGYKEVSEARVVMSSKYSHPYVISQPIATALYIVVKASKGYYF